MNRAAQPENPEIIDITAGPVVLAVDTSSPQAGLAIARGDRVIATVTDGSGRPHSQTLFANIAGLLGEAALSLEQMEAFAVITGPGSFTGLRVGMAAIMGLANTLNRPALGVTSLDAWAIAAGLSGRVLVMIDAMRGEVFCGLRDVQIADHSYSLSAPGPDMSAAPTEALEQLKPLIAGRTITVIGSGAERYQELIAPDLDAAAADWHLITDAPPLARSLARYAGSLVRAGETPAVEACYIRPSDAEIKFPQNNG